MRHELIGCDFNAAKLRPASSCLSMCLCCVHCAITLAGSFTQQSLPMTEAIAIHGHDIIDLVPQHPEGIRL